MVISCDIQNGKQGDWFIGDILKDIYIYIFILKSHELLMWV